MNSRRCARPGWRIDALADVHDRRHGGRCRFRHGTARGGRRYPIGNSVTRCASHSRVSSPTVTVHDVVPTDPPDVTPHWLTALAQRGWTVEGQRHGARYQAPNPLITSVAFAFDGITPYADAYTPKNTTLRTRCSTSC